MNHVIIGLGGTGGKIIRAFRKLIFREFRRDQPDGVDLAYLYVDSSSEMMAADDPTWKTLGVSMQLPAASQLLITDANLGARLEHIDSYPGIQPWIGSRDQWRDILNSIVGVTLGGQKRRLGRFLFACKIDLFRERVQALVRRVQASGNSDTTFHILCGLAGGTGSGSVIDSVAQLRDLYPDAKRFRILLYTLLPDPYPPQNWDTGNYHANGYSALLELNALSTGAWQPHDVQGVKGRLVLGDPFNGAYVFSNENDNGLTVDVDQELPGIVAEFLYQKIVRARQVGWPGLGRMENAENGNGAPETAPGGNRGERAKRFLSFGIKRIAIPEEEISEYLAYGFARQTLLQLAFNNWQETLGYAGEMRPQDFNSFVRQKDVLHRWALDDDHLLMNVPVLPGDGQRPKWQAITTEWEAVIPHFKSLVRDLERSTWLDELERFCRKRWDEDFRDLGVAAFFDTKLKSRKEIAREIRNRVERELCNDWRIGARGLEECGRLLAALIACLDERLNGVGERLAKARAAEDEAAARLQQNSRRWSEMSLLAKLAGSPASLLDGHAVYLQELYVNRTRTVAINGAKVLLQETLAELAELKVNIDQAAGTVRNALDRFGKQLAQRLDASGGDNDLRRHLIRFYDPAKVRAVARMMDLDVDVQRTQTGGARAALFDRLGETPTFAAFNQRISLTTLLDALEKTCEQSARLAHSSLIKEGPQRVLGVSIIERLAERFAADPQARRNWVTEVVRQAGVFMRFEPLEMQRVAPGIPAGVPTAIAKLTVIMPKSATQGEFVAALKKDFLEANAGDTEIIDADGCAGEITLVAIVNLFPLRYLKPLAVLRERYQRRLTSGDAKRLNLELHAEGDASLYPPLYVASPEELRRDGLPYILLASALRIIRQTVNPQTGAAEVLLLSKDADGFDNPPLFLGKTLAGSLEAIDALKVNELRQTVTQALSSTDWRHREKRLELQKAVLEAVEKIRSDCGDNLRDPVYLRFLDAGKHAVRVLKEEES
ncbi:MAG TPA: tubulin-like doman-containing protein [Accumulibacter sp.]|nr:tubulin-like doman-containing protein [Accumulibacter sp.]HMX23791.1 tubulin-like doman-containing protein [Accumulibacter sp.]HNC19153.1 tubulin-like doman-containing protein [Accumulibacter sp.]